MIMRKTTLALGLIAAIASVPAMAAVATGTLTVKANVVASCAVTTSGGDAGNAILDFGTIDSSKLGQDIDASTSSTGGTKLSVTCTNGTSYKISADTGLNPVSNQRYLKAGGTDTIAYNLYTDSPGGTVFPLTAAAATAVTGNGSTQAYDIYGRIPNLSALPAVGSYTDTVQLTVTY